MITDSHVNSVNVCQKTPAGRRKTAPKEMCKKVQMLSYSSILLSSEPKEDVLGGMEHSWRMLKDGRRWVNRSVEEAWLPVNVLSHHCRLCLRPAASLPNPCPQCLYRHFLSHPFKVPLKCADPKPPNKALFGSVFMSDGFPVVECHWREWCVDDGEFVG